MDARSAEELCYLIFAIASFILNITEITMILKRSTILKNFDKLLLSLSVGDLLISTAVIVFTSLGFAGVLGHAASVTYLHFIFLCSLSFSLTNLIAITIDRLIAVRFPIQHKMKIQYKLSNTIIAIMWTVSIILASTHLCLAFWFHEYLRYAVLIGSSFVLVLGVSFACIYGYMFRHILRIRWETKKVECDDQQQCSIRKIITQKRCLLERNFLITSSLVLFAFIFSTYPFAIETLVNNSSKVGASFPTQFCLLLNSALDPLVYFFKGYKERKG